MSEYICLAHGSDACLDCARELRLKEAELKEAREIIKVGLEFEEEGVDEGMWMSDYRAYRNRARDFLTRTSGTTEGKK